MKATLDTAQRHIAEQRDYVKKRHLDSQKTAAKASGPSGLVDERMLAESMRSVRYASEAHAAGDIIDNSIESGASQVHLIFRTEGTAIQEIAFIDDGSGIDESFLPHATKWGGSSNDGRRNVFGRFGFGLPSASVNRGRKFQVFSRIARDDSFAAVTVDLDSLSVRNHVVQLPDVSHGDLPAWIEKYVSSEARDGKALFRGGLDAVRTVVIWSSLDRLLWSKKQQASARFREHLGITYAGWLDVCTLVVDGEPVEPVDVLFTTAGARWYDIDGAPKADPHSSIRFEVADHNGAKRTVTVRFSYLSIDAHDATIPTGGRGRPVKIRQRIRKDYNGFFVTRHGRFIELVKAPFINWSVYARQVGVALDFPPELDELFGVTPDKQTIVFDERVEKLLNSHGVIRAFKTLVGQVEDERSVRKAEREKPQGSEDGPRPSEETIAKVVEMDVRRTRKTSEETREEAQQNFRERVKKLAEDAGVPEEQVAEAQEKIQLSQPYRVEFAKQTEDDPFYTPTMDNTQLVLRINTGHPWYRELYSRLTQDAEQRSALELVLWVLATCELDSTGDTRIFYRAERKEWSRRMANAFDIHPVIFHGAESAAELHEQDPRPWVDDGDDDVMEAD